MYAQLSLLVISLHLFFILPKHHAQLDNLDGKEFDLECSTKTFNCGKNVNEIGYPFWGRDRPKYCGLEGLKLSCENEGDHENAFATLDIGPDKKFRVQHINTSTREIRMERADPVSDDDCPQESKINANFNETLFDYGPDTEYLHLVYGCPPGTNVRVLNSIRNNFTCFDQDGRDTVGFFGDETLASQIPNPQDCVMKAMVPVNRAVLEEFKSNVTMELPELLNPSFVVRYKINGLVLCSVCKNSSAFCWPDDINSDGAYPHWCPKARENKMNLGLKMGIGFGAAAVGIACTVLAFFIYNRRKKTKHGSSLISRNISSYPSSMSDSEKGGNYRGVPIFSYNELEKATNNFDSSKEVGDGGFGTVYKGKLRDGRVVAIKRLYENNFKRVEQFMNEIEILAHLRHQNLVSLYGCTSQHCRQLLLVYEYIPNGTIADHLHGERAKPGSPSWKTRLSIAIETASALAYLHATDVIHRDVKTTNILLDNNFSVKVADFGLSRLFPLDVTHVSTAPQGTPGYVDPEYHECYQLTNKSDVYSFGVVLIELISSKPAVDITRHRHEINLSNMAINKIQNDALHELVDPSLGFESDYEVRKTITEVAELAFQCLANERDLRPSMQEVLKKLKGIQSKSYGNKNQVDVDHLDDDASLLKNNPQILSPDSVTVKWVSSSDASSYST